jgi:uncharacterized caspase-like protein
MDALFRKAGFDVVEVKHDLGALAMRRALRDFSDQVHGADIAVVSFAGHGIEVNGTNYLIPVDAVLERDIDVEDETVSLDRVSQVLEQAKRLRLIILDACRDNPYVRSMKRTVSSRSIGRGLAEVRVLSADTLIAFAARAGSTAADGDGTNSPYTIALAKHLITPGLDVRLALGRVRDEVLKTTVNRQEPFVYGSLGGAEISLVAKEPEPPSAPKAPPLEEARANYEMAERINTEAAWEAFLRTFKTGYHADLARERLRLLQDAAAAAKTKRKAEEEAAAKAQAEARAKARQEEERLAAEKRAREAEAARAEKPTTVAGRPSDVPGAPPSTVIPEDQSALQARLARQLQTELKRVGCDPGNVDGVWGEKAKGALAEFARIAKVTLQSDTPSSEALQAVLGQKGRVCPVQRATDQAASGGSARSRHKPGTPERPKNSKASPPSDTGVREKKEVCVGGWNGFCTR